MQTLKNVTIILVFVFLVMSLLPYGERTNPKTDPLLALDAPKGVTAIFKKACYDCHSNQTKWPWYSYIFPLSWSIKDHVKNGRASLNFDIWKTYDEQKRRKLRYEIARRTGVTMPLKQYLWFHKEARISLDEKKSVEAWAYRDTE